MKHRIYYSSGEQLYKIETKKFFGKWKTRESYLYTNKNGDFVSSKGFCSYDMAEEWLFDRFPGVHQPKNGSKKNSIGFEF